MNFIYVLIFFKRENITKMYNIKYISFVVLKKIISLIVVVETLRYQHLNFNLNHYPCIIRQHTNFDDNVDRQLILN